MAEPYLPDSEFKIRAGFQNYTEIFSGGTSLFNQGDYVLSWMGGEHADDVYTIVETEPGDWNWNWGSYYVRDNGMTPLRQIYPSASAAPSFSAVQTYFGAVYSKVV